MSTGAGPLAGVTAIEFAGLGPAPFAGMMLADQGARVIRIDRTPKRNAPKSARDGDVLSRGRESIAVTIVSEQVRGLCGIIFQLPPQLPDVGSHIFKLTPILHAPDRPKNPSVSHRQTGVHHQIMKKIKFGGR